MEKKTIGNFIAVLRKASGMTQQEMADKLNISNKAISRWERDECLPDLSLVPVIAEMFDVSCDELLKGERISSHADTSKSSQKIEKQIKQLFNRALSRFKSAVIIAVSINIMGFILLLAISYGFYKPVIGFALLCIFAIANIVLIFLSLNKLNDQIKFNELFDNLSEIETDSFKRTRYKYTFNSIFLNIMTIIWGLPFIIIRNYYFLDSVISFEYYFKLIPSLILIAFITYLVLNKIGLYHCLAEKQKFMFIKSVILLDIFQILCPVLIVAIVYLITLLGINIDNFFAILFYLLMITSLLLPVIYFCTKYKENRKMIVATGVRNIGLLLVSVIFSMSTSIYKIYDDADVIITKGIDYNDNLINIAIILFIFVIGGYLLAKKYWIEK